MLDKKLGIVYSDDSSKSPANQATKKPQKIQLDKSAETKPLEDTKKLTEKDKQTLKDLLKAQQANAKKDVA